MNSPSSRASPVFKNLMTKRKQSPIELKEKMRKNYKEKVQNCRDMLINRFRGSVAEDLHKTLDEIYKDMFNFSDKHLLDEEESEVLEVIKEELIQEEFEWWLEEYEKYQTNVDWSAVEDNNVICPICQKINFTHKNNVISCSICNIEISTNKSLLELKKYIEHLIESHSETCANEVQFSLVPEENELHIYTLCEKCGDMQLVI